MSVLRTPSKIGDISVDLPEFDDNLTGAGVLVDVLMVFKCPEEAMFKTKSPSKIDDIVAVVGGV